MPTLTPFKGLHYNPKTIPNLDAVISPPYDCIGKSEETKFLERSPYNITHLILGRKPEDDYSAQKELLNKWRSHSVLVEDTTPGFYLYRQTFSLGGRTHTRDTLMALVLLHDFADGVIRPHENTYGQYKADRLQLLRKFECNDSHIFGMVKDQEGFLAQAYEKTAFQPPLLQAQSEDGSSHTVWKIDPSLTTSIQSFFQPRPIYIVDGHHRYESSLMYAREKGVVGQAPAPAAHMLFAIANVYDPGLVVLPTHRLVRNLTPGFSRQTAESAFTLRPMTEDALFKFCTTTNRTPEFALWLQGQLFLCSPKDLTAQQTAHGPTLCQNAVLWSDWVLTRDLAKVPDATKSEHIEYEKDVATAWQKRENSAYTIFHAPLAVEEVTKVADEKRFMPQKTTFFFPKLAAGLILRSH